MKRRVGWSSRARSAGVDVCSSGESRGTAMWLAAETVALALAGMTYAQEPSFLGERGQGVRLSNLSGESLPVVRVEANDELARGRLEQLMRRSGTVREMLGTLHDSRHIFVSLRSSKDLWRLTGLDGRGTLRVAAGRIAADVEFDHGVRRKNSCEASRTNWRTRSRSPRRRASIVPTSCANTCRRRRHAGCREYSRCVTSRRRSQSMWKTAWPGSCGQTMRSTDNSARWRQGTASTFANPRWRHPQP